jgi:hypothetical protein
MGLRAKKSAATWSIYYPIRGHRVRESSLSTNKADAVRLLKRRLAEAKPANAAYVTRWRAQESSHSFRVIEVRYHIPMTSVVHNATRTRAWRPLDSKQLRVVVDRERLGRFDN